MPLPATRKQVCGRHPERLAVLPLREGRFGAPTPYTATGWPAASERSMARLMASDLQASA